VVAAAGEGEVVAGLPVGFDVRTVDAGVGEPRKRNCSAVSMAATWLVWRLALGASSPASSRATVIAASVRGQPPWRSASASVAVARHEQATSTAWCA